MIDEDFEEILESVRQFVREVVVPAESEIEATDAIPSAIRSAAASMGLFGFALPEEFGGLGLSMEREARLVFELGYTTPSFRSMFGTNNGIAGHVLMEGATQAQKEAFLPKLASGEWTASFALTEAESGSDPSTLKTTAFLDGNDYVLNGVKRWITNAPIADVLMVFARTDRNSPGAEGISCFLIESKTPGVVIGPRDQKMGQAGSWTSEVFLENVRVPPDRLIGETEGEGHKIAMRCLAHGRLHIAALCAGASQRLVDEAVGFARERRQSGRPISDFQLVQGLIADSVTDLMASRALVIDAARAYDSGLDTRVGPACAKYFASEAVGRVADRAVQIHGGAGYMRGVPVERFYRDVRLFRLYEGTSQIMQLIIARATIRTFGGTT